MAIIGPTAVGKTALGILLAEKFDGEIISGDSMQVYKGMDIGTAKATPEERERIPHHLIDIVEPWESFSVADFQRLALQAVQEIRERGRLPILVGGTGLYVKALLYYPHYSFTPEGKREEIRKKWEAFASLHGPLALHREAMKVDPKAAGKLHPHDTRRLVRILEEYELTGKPPSRRIPEREFLRSPFDLLLIGLTLERKHLYRRIEERVDRMMNEGLLEEVKRLLAVGVPKESTAMQGLGYKELIPYLEGKITLMEAVQEMKKRTRQFAKRQLTWFRHMNGIHWFSMEEEEREDSLHKIFQIVAGKFHFMEN
ncbi:tRNA dimethylallyltransferase [[Clostridium] ultunense Esp]|nr:tRNA dimethylallyltransferase [[Clostridium] ultunense Esp]